MREIAIRLLKKVVGKDQTGNMKYAFALALLLAEGGDTPQATKVIDTFKDLPLYNPRSLALRVLLLTCQNQNAQARSVLLEESTEFKKSSLLQLLFCLLSFIEAYQAAQEGASFPSNAAAKNGSEESKGELTSLSSPQQVVLQNIGGFEQQMNYKISSSKQISSSLRKSLRYFLETLRTSLSRDVAQEIKISSETGRELSLSGVTDSLTILEYFGRALIELSLPGLLENVVQKIKELYPSYPQLAYLEFKLVSFQKKFKREELIVMLDQLIANDTRSLELHLERIKLLSEVGASTRAISLCLALREQHPNDPDLLFQLGKLHEKENNFEVAADLQLKALEISSQRAVVPFERIALVIED